jgi:hypothetical protein
MSESDAVERLLDVLAPLLDREFCSAYPSAWELDPWTDWSFPDGTKADGEELHRMLVDAVEAVKRARQPA